MELNHNRPRVTNFSNILTTAINLDMWKLSNVAPIMAYCRYGRVCRLVKLCISMIRTFSFGNISHITLYAQLEIV